MSRRRSTRTVDLSGELTIQTVAERREALATALDAADDLRLRLSGVTELDTAGLQLLLVLKREAATLGKRIRLVEPNGVVREVLDIVRLDENLDHVSSSASAPALEGSLR